MYNNNYFHPFNPYNNEYVQFRNNTLLVRDIQKAINGEFSAISCYEKLAQKAPSQNVRDQILEIREDEKRHFNEFQSIYTRLTGRQPTAKITEECPNAYEHGVEAAFIDEQETVDFYLDLADKAQDVTIKESFRRAAADEQNHAVWFLYFLNK